MSDVEILEAIEAGDLKIEDMLEDCLEPASYDLRIGYPLLKGGEATPVNLSEIGTIVIRAGEFFTFLTHEKLTLKNTISGHLGAKSYFIQRGLILLGGQHVDPGFDGFLLMGAYNAAPRDIAVKYLDKICNIEFHRLAQPAKKKLREFPELQRREIPKTIRDYFMGIEPLSVYKLSQSIGALAENVSTMSREVTNLSTTVRSMSRVLYFLVIPMLGIIILGLITIAVLT